ncbi:MAG: DUF86 domain-containing protein [Candidatus Nomurabacteria bacterium]|nr:DUF86 domain-containing protein [Candidatus Nomurabacteria bacterium]
MTISQIFITEKARLLKEYIQKSKDIFGMVSDDKIILGSDNVYVLERMFQLAVEVVIDINNYLIKELDIEPAEDIEGTFQTLARKDILPMDFAVKISPTVGLRNKLVHVYEKVDRAFFVSNFRKNVDDFDKYISYVLKFVK